MDITVFITLFHIIGVALGVGGATVSDLLFFRALADKRISKDEFALLHTLGYILWAGLIILFLSGLGFVTYQLVMSGSSTYLVSAWFWAKMTIVFTLFCNALMMHLKVFPFMTAHLDTPLNYSNMHDKFVLLAITGTLSITSWYSAMILGVTRGFDFSYGLIINTYAIVVIAGILIAYILFVVVLFPKKFSKTTVSSTKQRRTPGPVAGVLLAALIGIILVMAAWYAAKVASQDEVVVEVAAQSMAVESHVVCITESMPWFTPAVLKVAVGDTVIWDHCHDEFSFADHEFSLASTLRSLIVASVYAEETRWPDAYTHTHSIMSVSGPVPFSSDLAPVGHVYEGDGFMVTFTESGAYEYISPTHPYMRGQVIVGEVETDELVWPPHTPIVPDITPAVSGVGEVWVALQFSRSPDLLDPGAVAVVDTATWQISRMIEDAAFHNPYQLALTSNSGQVLSTQWHSDRVVAINLNTNEVTDGAYLGNAPAHLTVHPTSGEVYVAMHNESRVAVLNEAGEWQRDISVPFGPHGIAISNDGVYLAVVSSLSGEFGLVALADEQIQYLIDLPDLPQEVIFTPDDLYAVVTSYLSDRVQVINLAEGIVENEIVLSAPMQGVALDPAGEHIWLANAGSNSVDVVSIRSWTVVASIPVTVSPQSITFGKNVAGGDYAYVSHRFARTLSVLDVGTRSVVGQIPLGSEGLGGAGLLVFDNLSEESVASDESE